MKKHEMNEDNLPDIDDMPVTEEREKGKETKDSESTQTEDKEIDNEFEEANEDGVVDVLTTIKKLREKIKKVEAEKKEYLDLSQRTRADYMNFKKEVESSRSVDRKFATRNLIGDLLPVLDAYDMAQANKQAWEAVDQNWRVGVEYIFGQLKSVLEKEGVTQFGAVGDRFDAALHESMEHVPVDDEEKNDTVVQVMQKGYKMGDVVLRPARVKTGEFKSNT
jgi:molecular chaperone GrpE